MHKMSFINGFCYGVKFGGLWDQLTLSYFPSLLSFNFFIYTLSLQSAFMKENHSHHNGGESPENYFDQERHLVDGVSKGWLSLVLLT